MISLSKVDMDFIRPHAYSNLVRIGSEGDGGYLLPEDAIKDITCCISFGIGYNHEFESHLQKEIKHLRVAGFDYSVGVLYFCRLAINGFLKLFLLKGSWNEFKERSKRFLSFLNFWVINNNNRHRRIKISKSNVLDIVNSFEGEISLLKIDIEGSEWEIFPEIDNRLENVACMIIEFHEVSKNLAQLKKIVKKLEQTHSLAHLHINNFSPPVNIGVPDFIEITFVQKKYQKTDTMRNELPLINLDKKTMPNLDDFSIIF
jgi:hypothetical protein